MIRERCKVCGAFLDKEGNCNKFHSDKHRFYERICNYCGKKYKGRGEQFCSRKCNSAANSPFVGKFDDKHPNWKGDDVGMYALHEYVASRKPKPKLCECCKEVKPYDLSSNGHTYTRNPGDWEWLCKKCHGKKDSFVRGNL